MEEADTQSLASDYNCPEFPETIRKLWELTDEIPRLTIESYVANKNRYGGVVRRAEGMGLDVGTFRDRLSALDKVVLLERESQRRAAARQDMMDLLKGRLAELEVEGSRENMEMSLVRLDLVKRLSSRWNAMGGKWADDGEGEGGEEDWVFVSI